MHKKCYGNCDDYEHDCPFDDGAHFFADLFSSFFFSCAGVVSAGHCSKGSRNWHPDAYMLHPKAVRPFTTCPWPHTGQGTCSSFVILGARGFFGALSSVALPAFFFSGSSAAVTMRRFELSESTFSTILRIRSLISRTNVAGEYVPRSICLSLDRKSVV